MDRLQRGLVDCRRSAQISLAFLRHARIQVARTSLAMFGLASRRQPESFLCPFVGFLLGHWIDPISQW